MQEEKEEEGEEQRKETQKSKCCIYVNTIRDDICTQRTGGVVMHKNSAEIQRKEWNPLSHVCCL